MHPTSRQLTRYCFYCGCLMYDRKRDHRETFLHAFGLEPGVRGAGRFIRRATKTREHLVRVADMRAGVKYDHTNIVRAHAHCNSVREQRSVYEHLMVTWLSIEQGSHPIFRELQFAMQRGIKHASHPILDSPRRRPVGHVSHTAKESSDDKENSDGAQA